MTKMRFGGFEFPYNPEKIKITMEKRVKVLSPIGGADIIQDLGIAHRVISGNGTLFGDDAFGEIVKMQNEFKDDNPAVLTLPGLDPFNAVLCRLIITGEAGDNTVSYDFLFREIPSGESEQQVLSRQYIAKTGDTLWSISAAFGVSVETLLRLNPHIINPFSVEAGREVLLK